MHLKSLEERRGKMKIIPVWNWKTALAVIREKVAIAGKNLLDFGCAINDYWMDSIYHGYDIEPETVEYLKKKGYYVDFWSTDDKFEIVMANAVYEHLDNDTRVKFLKRSSEVLRKEGKLIITFPNARNIAEIASFWGDRTHLFPPVPRDEGILMEDLGFEVEIYFTSLYKKNPLKILLNLAFNFYPQSNVLIIGTKK